MPIISKFPSGSGGSGGGIALPAVSGISTLAASGKAYVKWTDPEDIVLDGADLALWEGTLLVRKAGSEPTSKRDGVIVLDSTVRNQYADSYFCDSGLTNGVTYYYKFYPYTTTNTYTESDECEFVVTPSVRVMGIEDWVVTNMSAEGAGEGMLSIRWTDPAETITYDRVALATWGSTTVVVKAGGYATSKNDANAAYTKKVVTRNQYAVNGLTVSGLINGETYYVSFFPETTDGGINTSTTQRTTGIAQRIVIAAEPVQNGVITYNGNTQSPTWSNYNTAQMTIGGTTVGINAGSYEATFTPKGGYCWSDNSTAAKTIVWTISKAPGTIIVEPTAVTLNDDATTATFTVTRGGNGTITAISNDPTIASVSPVVSNDEGTVTFTVATAGGGGAVKTLSSLVEGDTVQINENGTAVDFYVAKHNYESGLNGAGRTLLARKEPYPTTQKANTSYANDFKQTTLKTWLNGTYKNMVDGSVSSLMGETTFYYSPNSKASSTTTMACSVFILSSTEFGHSANYIPVEGSKLPITPLLVSTSLGMYGEWTRTPYSDDEGNEWSFCLAGNNIAAASGTTNSYYVRPVFTVPGDTVLTSDPLEGGICKKPVGSGNVSGETEIIISVAESANYEAPADKTVGVTAEFIGALSDTSWEKISQVSAAGTAKNYWSLGDCKAITINGTVGTLALSNYTTYVYIIGFNHNGSTGIDFGTFKTASVGGIDVFLADSYYGNRSSYSGTKYFQMNHWGSKSNYNTNYGGWAACDMRYDILGSTNVAPSPYGSTKTSSATGNNPTSTCATSPVANTLMAALPSDLRAVMKPMTVYTDNKGGGNNTASNVTATVDYLPLMSEFEVGGSRRYANSAEQNYQKQYEYFSAGNSARKYKHNATSTKGYFWVRSPGYDDYSYFCYITANDIGSINQSEFLASLSCGLTPIFRV